MIGSMVEIPRPVHSTEDIAGVFGGPPGMAETMSGTTLKVLVLTGAIFDSAS